MVNKRKRNSARRAPKPLDRRCLDACRTFGGWTTSREIAKYLGASPNEVAFSMRRLVEQCFLEEDIRDRTGHARSVEHTRVYRARPQCGEIRRLESILPGWLAPQAVVEVGTVQLIKGTASMDRWSRQDVQRSPKKGAPGPEANGPAKMKVSSFGAEQLGLALADSEDE